MIYYKCIDDFIMTKKELGQRIKKIRLEKGLSQSELAKLLFYKNHSTLAKVETGVNDITIETLYKYAKALDVEVSDILFNEQELKEVTDIYMAKEILLKGGLVIFPTETVMGIGIIFNNIDAFHKLNKVKGRPENKPYTLMVKDVKSIECIAFLDEKRRRVITSFMPGSLTVLLPKKKGLPSYVAPSSLVGVRIPRNKEAIRLLKAVNFPLLVPSANKSGEPPALTSQEAYNIFKDEVDYYMDGNSYRQTPSTIVDLSKDQPVLVRKGPISYLDIFDVWNEDASQTVLIYLKRNNQFLMLYRNKEENDINKGKYIGVGGHLEKGETPEQALIREVKEETGLDLHSYTYYGKVFFSDTGVNELMHVYVSSDFTGELIECDEGELKWVDIDQLKTLPMWEGDYLFLDKIFNKCENPFTMVIKYNKGRLEDHYEIKE